jgi:hypothetical protein
MSQSTNPDDEFAEYRANTGAEIKTADVSGDTHPVKQELGRGDVDKQRIYDPKIAGERFVQFYDDSAAAIREYLSNAETACIRRARHEIEQAGRAVPSGVSEILQVAREETGYEPLIEVTYNEQSDATRFIVEDNGIGISVEEYQVVQRVGYSTSHANGERLGQFGMGWMSGFQLTSVNGAFRMYTRSRLTDEAYSTIEYVANFEYLDGKPQEYGTRFEFPEFSESAKEIDITTKVREFSEGMRVPVLYRHFDSSGEETSQSDDYLPSNMEDDYPDGAFVVTYEDEFFKAVMSPESSTNRRNGSYLTYNVTMPIRRNTDKLGRNPSFDATWKWDFRGKREDGPVVSCDENPEIVGRVPIEDSKYEKLSDEQRDGHVRVSEVPDSAIVMPEPASSRDSYMSGHDEFWAYVSHRLEDAFVDSSRDIFNSFDTWSQFKQLSMNEKQAAYRCYSKFGPGYQQNDPENIQATLNEELGVTLSKDVCKKIDQSRSKKMVVPRGDDEARLKTPAKENKKRIWEIITEAPDGVYMAKAPSQKKAEIAWGLGDTHVLRVNAYEPLQEMWGFKKLKSLPSRNLSEKLPELDDDVVEKWEHTPTTETEKSSSNTTHRRTSRDPSSKEISVRVGSGSPRKMSRTRVSRVVRRLRHGNTIRAGRYDCNRLIVYDQTELDGSTPPSSAANTTAGIAVAAVPKYVSKYLDGTRNIYTDEDEAYADLKQSETDEFDVADTIIFAGDEIAENTDSESDVRKLLNEHSEYDIDDAESIAVFEKDRFDDIIVCQQEDFDATILNINGGHYTLRTFSNYTVNVDMVDIILEREIADADYSSPYFKQIFGRKEYCNADSDDFHRGIEMVKEMGGKFPDQ